MRLLWTLLKIVVALCLVIPISIIVLATALGIFGALLGLAILALRVAIIGLIGYGVFRLGAWLLRDSKPRPQPVEVKPLPRVDPHYEAAMRELDRELGEIK
ncbi:MAG TPA: hypothetical protein VFT29_03395 [Gemmatimonadaceae bacterium]|nr:hypothetical protein [Gemmatimonadaceae bacterium]